jgi:uncharacterized protein
MIRDLVFGLGLIAVIEGLVLALLPLRLEDLLTALAQLSAEQRRLYGLLAVTLGVALVWLSRA